jgi:two-component system, NtrC family, sensor kinase
MARERRARGPKAKGPVRGSGQSRAESTAPAATSGDAPARILVVEDDRLVASSLRRVLAAYAVSVVDSGREAQALLLSNDFELIICDLMIPDLTGMDIYERLDRDRPHLCARFVFMTGGAFTARAKRFVKEFPSERRVEKPFDPEGLVLLVRKLLAQKV